MASLDAAEEPSFRGLGGKEKIIFAQTSVLSTDHDPVFDPRAKFALRTQLMNTEVLDTILRLSS